MSAAIAQRRRSWTYWRASLVALLLVGLLGGAFGPALTPVARAATLTVKSAADDGGTDTLRAVVARAIDGDTITFDLAAMGSGTITLTSTITTDKVITIQGPGAAALTIERAAADANKFRLFDFTASGTVAVVVSGLTLHNGDANGGDGGAIRASGALTVTSSTLSDNKGAFGGGLFIRSTATVTSSTFSNNSGDYGGGFFANAAATVTSGTFSNNSATVQGGGLASNDATIVLSSTFANNSAPGGKGGALYTAGSFTVTGSTISGNTAETGGGVYARGSALVTNDIFTGNTATNSSGGLFAYSATIVGTVFDGNGAMYGAGGVSISDTATIKSSTFNANHTLYGNGGGLLIAGITTLMTSTFTGNNAAYGGGYYASGNATIINTTFASNAASNAGGGLYVSIAVTVTNSTFSNNSSTYDGGGITSGGTVTLANNLFAAGSTGKNCTIYNSGTLTDNGGTISSDASCVTSVSSKTNTPPGLDPTGIRDNGGPTLTFATTSASPARGYGTAANCPPIDQRGAIRPSGVNCDSGAVQAVIAPPAPTTLAVVTPNTTPVVPIDAAPLTITLDGTGFVDGFATVTLAGMILTTTYVSPTRLIAAVPATLRVVAGQYPVTVTSISYGGGTTSPLNFTVTNALPTLTGLNPSPGVAAGAGDTTLTLNGTGFAPGATVSFGGATLTPPSNPLPTATTLIVTVPAALLAAPRTVSVAVTNPGPGGGSSTPLFFTVAPTPAVVSLAPPALGFGAQQVGTTSDSQQATLSNTGGSPFTITAVTIVGTNPGDFALTYNTCVGDIPANTSCVVGVHFAPTVANGRAATLQIDDSAAGSPRTATLTGTGTPPAPPSASVAPMTLPFGEQRVGTASDSRQVTLSNGGGSPLTIGGVTLTGTNPGDFGVTFNTCVGDIPARSSCVIGVRFAPATAGDRAATLSVADNAAGSPQTVALSGTGTPPPASPIPQSVVTASASGGGSVSPAGQTSYATGSEVTYAAVPAAGQLFIGWTLDGQYVGYASPLSFTVSANRTLVGTFVARPTFADVPTTDQDYQAITTLAALGLINPSGVNGSGQFQPSRPVARAEVAAFIARTFGWEGEFHGNSFPDKCDPTGANCVDDKLWNDVAALKDYGVVGGYNDAATCATVGSAAPCYDPRGNVLKLQVVSIVARAFTKAPDLRPTGFWDRLAMVASQYTNVPDAGSQRSDLATYRANAGPIPGQVNDGTFPAPTDPATRRFVIEVLWQAYSAQFGVDRVP